TPSREGCATRPAASWKQYAPQDGGQSCASRTSRSPAQGPSPGGIPLNRPTYNLAQRPPTGGEAERKPTRQRPFGYRPARRPITVIVCRLGRFRRIARCMVATGKAATRRSPHAGGGVPGGGEDHRGRGGVGCRLSRAAATAGRGPGPGDRRTAGGPVQHRGHALAAGAAPTRGRGGPRQAGGGTA